MQDIRRIAEYLDTKYKLPFGWKFGWDGILGLVPGVGDTVTNVLSFYIIIRAAQLGCPPSVILRMGINVLVDNLIDIFPLLGNIFDFFWKSNTKNIQLLEEYMAHPRQVTTSSRIVVFLVLAIILAMMILTFYLAFKFASWLWDLVQSQSQSWTV